MYSKNKFTKITIFLFIILFLFHFSPVYGDDLDSDSEYFDAKALSTVETSGELAEDSLSLNSRSCVVFDRVSKKVLFGKNETNKVKMASTTKIMTATVIIENCDLNETVEVSKKAAGTGGSRLGLKTGDKITIHDLLYGLMLCSGNDAAVALAESIAGSVEEFAKLMNQKAIDLGLTNTHFESPHGLDSDEHYTTAYELALLSDYALKNPTFAQIVGTKTYTITINGYPKTLSNTNELLGNLNGVYGIKTGFTNGANRCLVSACKRDNMDIICVVLGADTKKFRTQDSIKLIEYSFKSFDYINIAEMANKKLNEWKENYSADLLVYKGCFNYIDLQLGEIDNSMVPVKKEVISGVQVVISIDDNLQAPICNGDVVGSIEFISENEVIAHVDIIAGNDVSKRSVFDYLYLFFEDFVQIFEDFFK